MTPHAIVALSLQILEIQATQTMGDRGHGNHARVSRGRERVQQTMGEQEGRQKMHRKLQLVAVSGNGAVFLHHAGIVNQDVQPRVTCGVFLCDAAHLREIGQVRLEQVDPGIAAAFTDPSLGGTAPFRVAAQHHHTGLPMSQLRGGGQANPGVGAGDEANLAGHVHGVQSVLWRK